MNPKKKKKIEKINKRDQLIYDMKYQTKSAKKQMLNYTGEHLSFLWSGKQKSILRYPWVEFILNVFLKVNNFFWKVLWFFPFSIVGIFVADVCEVISFLVFLKLRKTLMFGAFKGLDFKEYSFLQKNKALYGIYFYLYSLTWPREKWYFLLRKLTWKERAFKFFLSGPFGWLGFFYYFFFVRALTVSAYWALKILISIYMFLPKVSREESILWNINKLNLLERRFEDKSLFPGFSIDMSMYFYLYLRLAVYFGIIVF